MQRPFSRRSWTQRPERSGPLSDPQTAQNFLLLWPHLCRRRLRVHQRKFIRKSRVTKLILSRRDLRSVWRILERSVMQIWHNQKYFNMSFFVFMMDPRHKCLQLCLNWTLRSRLVVGWSCNLWDDAVSCLKSTKRQTTHMFKFVLLLQFRPRCQQKCWHLHFCTPQTDCKCHIVALLCLKSG